MNYSIGARPTLELFFTTDEGHTFCVDVNGELTPAPDEDLSMLRWALISGEDLNSDAKAAIQLARVHARDNGWTLSDEVFFN
jgi:hypothetical protein